MDLRAEDFESVSMDWGVVVRDARSGVVLFEHGADKVLKAASVGKLILLAFTGNELLKQPKPGAPRLDRRAVAPVADSGLWRHLDVDTLGIADVVKLVFLASDNLATNVLINHFGLERVRAFRGELGFVETDLLDVVRDERGPDDPFTLSLATAGELCEFMTRIVQGQLVGPTLSDWLWRGLSLSLDLSMVPSGWGIDPLSRPSMEHGRPVPGASSKTGVDTCIRADSGILSTSSGDIAYAALCNFDQTMTAGREVRLQMREIGEAIRSSRPDEPSE